MDVLKKLNYFPSDLCSPMVIKRLLSLGVDVNTRDENGQMLLHQLALYNWDESSFSSMELLLSNGADVNAMNVDGRTPLHRLLQVPNSVKVVRLLLDFGADVSIKDNLIGIPLVSAIKSLTSKVAVVKLLMDHSSVDVNCNLKDDFNLTLLHHACYSGSEEMVEYFLKNGADVNAISTNGRTPLMCNLSNPADPMVAKSLLKYTDLNVIDSKGDTVMNIAINNHKLIEPILKIVAKYKALNLPLHPKILLAISKNKQCSDYLDKCLAELSLAKRTKTRGSWVTYFDLIVHSKTKLKNYAGNNTLIQDLNWKEFDICGNWMHRRVKKGIQMRMLFDKSADILSNFLPILNPTHLILRDTVDCLSFRDYDQLVLKV